MLSITVDTLVDEADGSIVDGDTSLRDALVAAVLGEKINFDTALDSGTINLTLGELSITKGVTIDATMLAGGLTVDALGNDPTPGSPDGLGSRAFNIDDADELTNVDVAIRGLTITGGDVAGVGGAIRSVENLSLSGANISGNSTFGDFNKGGAIYSIGFLRIAESTLSDNSTSGLRARGGAIYSAGIANITDSTISGNAAGGVDSDGGGLTVNGLLNLNDSHVTGNTGSDGGGIFGAGLLRTTNSTISDNYAVESGGGVYTTGGVLTTTDTTISGNTAMLHAGGIFSRDTDIEVTRSNITSNSSGVSGAVGGIDSRTGDDGGSNMVIVDSTISDNIGIGVSGDDTTISGSTISGNAGGGFVGSGSTLYLVDSVVSENTRSGSNYDGGGVKADHATIIRSTIRDNRVTGSRSQGGGIKTNGLVLIDSTVTGNFAEEEGGGVYNRHGDVDGVLISNSTISGNSAGRNGGGVFLFSSGTIVGSTITGNTSQQSGGGLGSDYGGSEYHTYLIEVRDTIIANNLDDGTAPDFFPANRPVTLDYSLLGDNTGSGLTEAPIGSPDANGNLTGGPINGVINPLLGLLSDNGGPTETHALLSGSPAIDAGDPSAMAGVGDVPLYDQRGFAFSRVVGGRIDMGSVEASAVSANFDEDGDVDGGDFLAWQRGFGTVAPNATNADGDADVDKDVDGDDLGVWESQFGLGVGVLAANSMSTQSAPAQAAIISSPPTVESIAPAELIDAVMAMELLSTSIGGDEDVVVQEQLLSETSFDPAIAPKELALSSGLSSFLTSRTTSSAELDEALVGWSRDVAINEVFERVFG